MLAGHPEAMTALTVFTLDTPTTICVTPPQGTNQPQPRA